MANLITLSRFPILIVVVLLLYAASPLARLIGVFVLALLIALDTVDGVVARRTELHSILFALLEDLQAERAYADKIIASVLPGRRGNREFFCFLTTDREKARRDLGKMIEDALAKAF